MAHLGCANTHASHIPCLKPRGPRRRPLYLHATRTTRYDTRRGKRHHGLVAWVSASALRLLISIPYAYHSSVQHERTTSMRLTPQILIQDSRCGTPTDRSYRHCNGAIRRVCWCASGLRAFVG
eukprot:scaffold68734_cov32-Tisochrysis_lutea.AAC.1